MKKHIKTPSGIFPVYVAKVAGAGPAATVIYHIVHPAKPGDGEDMGTYEFRHHIEVASTETLALEQLGAWCAKKFGPPCAYL